MSLLEPTPLEQAQAHLDAVTARHQTWRRAFQVALACGGVASLVLVLDIVGGFATFWLYLLLVVCIAVCFGVSLYDRAWMLRVEKSMARASRAVERERRLAAGPQDAVPDDDTDWGPYR